VDPDQSLVMHCGGQFTFDNYLGLEQKETWYLALMSVHHAIVVRPLPVWI